jgi:hypothetical protein
MDDISFIKGQIIAIDVIISELEYRKDLLHHQLVDLQHKHLDVSDEKEGMKR